MKKILKISISLLIFVMIFAGCTSADPGAAGEPEGAGSAEATATFPPLAASPTPEVKPTTYKESMLPFDQLVPGDRIVILQNTINYSREGFYTPETKPVTQEIDYGGESVAAYPMSYAIAFLNKELDGNLTLFNNDGSKMEINPEEFSGLFVIIDFTSDAPPVLYNPDIGMEITNFHYALTAEGEAIYSVVSGSIHDTKELITKMGWDPELTYRYVATDQFYFPVGVAEVGTGEVRGTLSGAVNGSFPDLKIASGKINDLVYIEKMDQ